MLDPVLSFRSWNFFANSFRVSYASMLLILAGPSSLAQEPSPPVDAPAPVPNNVPAVAPVLREEWRLPVSFRQTSVGLEVAYIHEGVPKMLLSEKPPGTSQGTLDRGDVILEVNNNRVQSEAELFSQLAIQGPKLPIDIINTNNKQRLSLLGSPRRVKVPMPARSISANGEGKIVVIHAALTSDDDPIGKNLEVNLQPMKELFDNTVSPQYVRSYVQLVGTDCSAQGIVNAVSAAAVEEQDTLFVYYQGHGAYSQAQANEDPAAGHFLDFATQDLLRRDLLAVMLSKGARFTVLISDACNVEESIPIDRKPVFEAAQIEVEGWTPLEEFLLCHRGVLDLTSASRGQAAWSTSDIGGWFTAAFIEALSPSNNVETSLHASWSRIKRNTETIYGKRRVKLGVDNPKLRRQELMVPQEIIWSVQRDEHPGRPSGTRSISTTVSSIPGL